MFKNDLVRLRHMLDAAREAIEEMLYRTVAEDLPPLIVQLEKVVPPENQR